MGVFYYRDEAKNLEIALLDGDPIYGLELPYKGNQTNISSIDGGLYPIFKRSDTKIQLQNVEGRTGIQVHSGNNLNSANVRGCIIAGILPKPMLDCEMFVHRSRDSVKELIENISFDKDFLIFYPDHSPIDLGSCNGLIAGMKPSDWNIMMRKKLKGLFNLINFNPKSLLLFLVMYHLFSGRNN